MIRGIEINSNGLTPNQETTYDTVLRNRPAWQQQPDLIDWRQWPHCEWVG